MEVEEIKCGAVAGDSDIKKELEDNPLNRCEEQNCTQTDEGAGYLVECRLFRAEYCCAYCGRTLRARRLLIRHIVAEHDPSVTSMNRRRQTKTEKVPMRRKYGRPRNIQVRDGEGAMVTAFKRVKKKKKISSGEAAAPQKVSKCEWCGFESAHNSTLKRHAMRHTGTRPFACQFCQHTTTHRSQLERHLLSKHRNQVLASLATAATATSSTSEMVAAATPSNMTPAESASVTVIDLPQQPQQHPSSGQPLQVAESTLRLHRCTECDFSSPYSSSVVKHTMSKHSGEKRFACPDCDFRTVHSSSLKLHLMVHTGVKPYACPHCDYRTTFSRNLARHLSKHTGERPYPCGVCGFRSTTPSSHKRHLMTHTDVRPFKCQLCTFQTCTRSSLKQHNLVVHLGSRPFHCDQCTYTTTRSYYLKLHKLRHVN